MKRNMQRYPIDDPTVVEEIVDEMYPEDEFHDYHTNTVVQPRQSEVRPLHPHDPSTLGYPATLPIEVALKVDTIENICGAYKITRATWQQLCQDKSFKEDYRIAQGLISEGFGFKLKAALQADALLKTSWEIIHDKLTPPNVKADLIKSTVRWAGHDAPTPADAAGSGFSININFTKPNEPRILNNE